MDDVGQCCPEHDHRVDHTNHCFLLTEMDEHYSHISDENSMKWNVYCVLHVNSKLEDTNTIQCEKTR